VWAYLWRVDIEPDTKDWTWVLREPCPECGFDASAPSRDQLASLAAEVGERWIAALDAADDLVSRPAPTVWSPLEYACHVRDVCALASYRVRLMRDEDAPRFANWDQDATALEQDYGSQDPAVVRVELAHAAREFADVVAAVPDSDWERTGLRGDGAEFTVESFTRYLIHDPVHHLTDITGRAWA
jgi:hypothetical protein